MTSTSAGAGASGWDQRTLDALVVPVFSLDPDYRYVAFNAAHARAMKETWGADIEVGHVLFDYITAPDNRAEARANMVRAMTGKQITSNIWFGADRTSGRLYSLIRSPILEGRRIVGVAAVQIDETDRNRAEQETAESERRYRATFEQATVGMAQVALDGRWTEVNDRLVEMLGYSRRELLALTFADITFEETIDADMSALRRLSSGSPEPYHTEKRYIRKDRSMVWVDVTVSPVLGEDGATEYFVDIIEDIDDRKRAEEAVRASEERYRALVEAVRDIVFVIDRDDRVQFANDAAAAWLQSTPAAIAGRRRAEVFPAGDEWARHQAVSLKQVLDTGEPLYIEHPAQFPEGMRWQATSLAPLRDADGRVTAVLGIGRDITERKEAEQRRVGELEQLAHGDALTGLLNLRGFELLAAQAMAQASRAEQGVGVIYADMDDLKGINDECGHALGDQALRDIATILRVTLRSADVIARVGGDEFLVLAVGENEDAIRLLVDRLQEGIEVFNGAQDGQRPLSISCGMSWGDPRTMKVGQLVAAADREMYRQKSSRSRGAARR
jgi:diguanylate cyclase (GGDEF)-like protein/PAS domain S-box-containing protein